MWGYFVGYTSEYKLTEEGKERFGSGQDILTRNECSFGVGKSTLSDDSGGSVATKIMLTAIRSRQTVRLS